MFIHTFCLYMGGVERVKFTTAQDLLHIIILMYIDDSGEQMTM